MVRIAFAIMLIFIATTNCALRDCSKDELVDIAIEANRAHKDALGLPSIGLQNYAELDELDLIREIKHLAKEGGKTVQLGIKNSLLGLRKLHVYPVFEAISHLPREKLFKLCSIVDEYARQKHGFGGLMDRFNEYSTKERIVEALESFAKDRSISGDQVMNITFVINSMNVYEAAIEHLNIEYLKIEYLKAFALGIEKLSRHVNKANVEVEPLKNIDSLTSKQVFEKIREFVGVLIENSDEPFDTLKALYHINCWDIIANSEKISGEELYYSIKAQLILNEENN
jgi:hypothetical protein